MTAEQRGSDDRTCRTLTESPCHHCWRGAAEQNGGAAVLEKVAAGAGDRRQFSVTRGLAVAGSCTARVFVRATTILASLTLPPSPLASSLATTASDDVVPATNLAPPAKSPRAAHAAHHAHHTTARGSHTRCGYAAGGAHAARLRRRQRRQQSCNACPLTLTHCTSCWHGTVAVAPSLAAAAAARTTLPARTK